MLKKAEVLAKINALVGAEEFKRLAQEIVTVAPEITKNGTKDIFMSRAYLFSVNDGYGLTTCLNLLAELVPAVGIANLSGFRPVNEVKLAPVKEGNEPFAEAMKILDRDDIGRVVCIDISEWMNSLNNRYFREFLLAACDAQDKNIIVFRIPFVDEEIRERIRCALNDLMYIHTVSFPPFSIDEIRSCARAEVQRYGFKVANSAWRYFAERITEEKRDGKFYGLNTVKKVVRELLYKKQLDNAVKRKSDFTVSSRDMRALCNASESELGGFEMLDTLVGSENIKQRIIEIIAQIEVSLKNPGLDRPCIHMRFTGNPGTGKTTVARIIGKILNERGVLRVGSFFEYSGRDFCGRYIGETAPKTSSMCRDAYGSVLFIDEAYSLYRGDDNDRDFGREALDTLIAEMENHRNDFVVIMAGYTDDMTKLMNGNQGLASRMPYTLEFPNFTNEQLYEIFARMLDKGVKYSKELLSAAREYFMNIPKDVTESKEFSNARFVRNLFERTCAKAALRCQLEKRNVMVLNSDDFERSISEKEFSELIKKKTRIGFGM